MKKNKMMRLASGLLVAVLLTSSVVSGTFAKYVTTGTAGDTARVAKWGVKINATGLTDTFSETYDTTVAVGTSNVMDLIAPGTDGELTDIKLSGTPEVSVRVYYNATFDLVGFNDYCPIVIKVDDNIYGTAEALLKTSFTGTQVEVANAEELETKVLNAINVEHVNEYGPNKDLSSVTDDNLNVAWEWPFEVDDAKDTILGNAAAEEHFASINLQVTVNVEQID